MEDSIPDDPWHVDPAGFAACGSTRERLRFLVTYAVLAPSGHNTQPWIFRFLSEDKIELRADRSRGLRVVDPDDRALVISCGAALANLRLAAASLGVTLHVEVLPEAADPDLLARIHYAGEFHPAAPDGDAVLCALTARRTTRRPFSAEPLSSMAMDAATQAVKEYGDATLEWAIDQDHKHALALLIAEGDRVQMADPAFRRELADWVHSRRAVSRDGISGAAFGMPDLLSFAGALVIRSFDMGDGQAARDLALAEGAPALAVITTSNDTPRDWMAAGEAMERALIQLARDGFTYSYLNQPIEVPNLRPRLAAALSTTQSPQILIRIGRTMSAVPPAVRRPVSEVLRG
jgi:nitroreductase